jgi:hypothetical protein
LIGGGELQPMLTASNISITGWLMNREQVESLDKIDVYLQTSLWEGFTNCCS